TGLWRLCIDFFDLNQACPKDSYPIPHIDYLVDATSRHQLMSFLDAYSGYNQIPMHLDDAEHTSFYSARGLYCYVMMTFGLKNAGATYQRLVNKMFARLIGHTMEVYVDDMLVKSEQASDHIAHLFEVFDILREYSMVLNPKKCTFGVGSGKFLGYMVSQRGIEANPAKIQAILGLAPPTSIKGVQALTGRLAALIDSFQSLQIIASRSLTLSKKRNRSNGPWNVRMLLTTSKKFSHGYRHCRSHFLMSLYLCTL
ncbi:Uncharacterized mitochondrial protein AtMg00860, partial [Striga hermonthica]